MWSDDSLEQPDDRPTVPTYTTNGGVVLTDGDLKLLSGSGVFLSVKAAEEIRQLRQSLAEAKERVRLLEAVREAAESHFTILDDRQRWLEGAASITRLRKALAAAKESK